MSLRLGSTPVMGNIIKLPHSVSYNVVLGTANAAWDLLEKRSDIYSSRPRFIVGYAYNTIDLR